MKIEQILGIIGGIFGLISAFFVMMIGALGEAFYYEDASLIIGLGTSALLFSIIGLVGGVIADRRAKIGGGLMIIAGIFGFISISAYYLLAGPFFLIGGVMALLHSRKKKDKKLEIEAISPSHSIKDEDSKDEEEKGKRTDKKVNTESMRILKTRYAKGEISKKEYEEMKKVLEEE